jgi:hypothetical protein
VWLLDFNPLTFTIQGHKSFHCFDCKANKIQKLLEKPNRALGNPSGLFQLLKSFCNYFTEICNCHYHCHSFKLRYMNWLIVFLIRRNIKDEKDFEEHIQQDYRKPKDEEDDIEVDEVMK